MTNAARVKEIADRLKNSMHYSQEADARFLLERVEFMSELLREARRRLAGNYTVTTHRSIPDNWIINWRSGVDAELGEE